MYTIGKMSINASMLHESEAICIKKKFQLISLSGLRENR